MLTSKINVHALIFTEEYFVSSIAYFMLSMLSAHCFFREEEMRYEMNEVLRLIDGVGHQVIDTWQPDK